MSYCKSHMHGEPSTLKCISAVHACLVMVRDPGKFCKATSIVHIVDMLNDMLLLLCQIFLYLSSDQSHILTA